MQKQLHNEIVPQDTKQESEADVIDLNDVNNIQLFKEQKIEYRCQFLRIFLKCIPYQVFITLITIFILFSDSIRNIALQKNDDLVFDIIEMIIMGIYIVEIILSSIAIENYIFSFFFWLDLISTLTIIMDVNLFTNYIFSYATSYQSSSISKIASQSKASRAATRAVKIVRLIRLIRIVKLYKASVRAQQIKNNLAKQKLKQKKKKMSSQKVSNNQVPQLNQVNGQVMLEQGGQTALAFNFKTTELKTELKTAENQTKNAQLLFNTEILQKIQEKESKLSIILSDTTIKKVIIVVLAIMFIVPLFQPFSYTDTNSSMDFFVMNLSYLLKNSAVSINDIIGLSNSVINDHVTETTPLVYFSTPFNQLPTYQNPNFYSIRFDDTLASIISIDTKSIMSIRTNLTINQTAHQTDQIIAVLNIKQHNDYTSYFQIGRTLFICIVLGILLNFFTNDINSLIIEPIQYMIQKVKNMALNPTAAANDLIQQTQYETAIVHNAIMKIGSLLSIVFGNAGAQIIGTNMMRQGQLNPLTKGKKKCAIYGFCDIRDFTDATEVLQEDIMVFVNQIGQIVHSSVYRYGGSANKNIGDAFLLVWKIPEQKYKVYKNNHIDWIQQRYISILCDFALMSFIKIIVKINKQPKILRYRKDQRLLQRLGPNYQVKMGFGLHIGWAIQGAIGSQYKIDASYLSPNVNMASRLEAATKQYGVPLLISSAVFDKLSPQMKQFCRNIDRVTVKGSNQPIGLYTVDLDLNNISPPADKIKKYPNPDQVPDIEFKRQLNMEYLGEQIQNYDAYTFIENKKQLREVLMINLNLQDFKAQFELGFEHYINGDWSQAIEHFNQAMRLKDDGPTKTLLEYIHENIKDGMAPSTWKNYRQLTQK